MNPPERSSRFAEIRDTVATLYGARLLTPLRPDRYLRMAAAVRRERRSLVSGFAMSAQRCPDRPALIDELGTLTWKELDESSDAFAAALQESARGAPKMLGIMCRNHRGFLEALIAAYRVGADVLLLNTAFAGPALAEVVRRENVDTVVYDEEFTATVDRALAEQHTAARIVAWADNPADHDVTVDKLIRASAGKRPARGERASKLILLTSGTTGTPKGAKASSGGPGVLASILARTPWRAEECTVVMAPMFHAWGFGQLMMAAMMSCTVVTRRKFDPETTLELIDRNRATGLSLVPVMFDRIMGLPTDVLDRYSARTLRFAAASGSRMRPEVVIAFMDRFGDVVYNNYNATEAGMIATATPADLRNAPDTAGTPAAGTEIAILDDQRQEVAPGTVGTIYVRNKTQFGGYTSGTTKEFHDGYLASGDIGYVDSAGLLFVVGRDDEMIVSGGENVYPIEVEKTLAAHRDVAEASVLGVDDEQYGQRLVAFVVLEDQASATVESLKQHVRDNLANYKVPREIFAIEELPRSSTGKIARGELQARANVEHGTSRH
jgi:acyl-CoA synthetase (AMP-forming)/AMP-acid ligase II